PDDLRAADGRPGQPDVPVRGGARARGAPGHAGERRCLVLSRPSQLAVLQTLAFPEIAAATAARPIPHPLPPTASAAERRAHARHDRPWLRPAGEPPFRLGVSVWLFRLRAVLQG